MVNTSDRTKVVPIVRASAMVDTKKGSTAAHPAHDRQRATSRVMKIVTLSFDGTLSLPVATM